MTFKEHCRSRLPSNIERLQRLVNMAAPDLILANEVVMLLNLCKGAFGKELVQAQLKYDLQGIRQGWAYCQSCDNGVAIAMSHHPVCERCDARNEAWADDVEQELRELEDDPDGVL